MDTAMTLLITGSSGLIGSALIERLASEHVKIIALTSDVTKLKTVNKGNVIALGNDEFINDGYNKQIDVAIHCAFARSGNPKLIADSIRFCSRAFLKFKELRISKVVNISSQSVYAKLNSSEEISSEHSEIGPVDLYGMGKYASEILLNSVFADSSINYFNIRLASVMENARFPNVFVNNVIANKNIDLYDGSQIASFIDLRDVVEALKSVIETEPQCVEHVYNLGTGEKYSVLDIANIVNCKAAMFGLSPVSILINPPKTEQSITGMDSSKFKNDFRWNSRYSISEMIEDIYRKLLKGYNIE